METRDQLAGALKVAMLARDPATTSAVRMIMAKLKDLDISLRPKGIEQAPESEVTGMLRGMVKSRRESIDLYRQGGRADLVAKEEAEIAVIGRFLPPELDDAAIRAAVAEAIAATGAARAADMGKVMGALKAKHGAALDLGVAGPLVRAVLAG